MEQSLKALEFDKLLEVLTGLAESEAGREKLATLAPLRSTEWVREELTRVDELRGFIDRGSSFATGGLKDLRPIMRKVAVAGAMLSSEELLNVLLHLRVHHNIRRTIDRERERMTLTAQLARPLSPLPDLETSLEKAISPDATVRDNASGELYQLRRTIVAQQNRIREKLNRLLPRLARQGVLREESFSVRDGRYVLPVRSDAFRGIKGIIHDRSSTGGTLFVEPTALIDLGNELRSLELAERDEIRRILAHLTEKVRDDLEQIEDNQDVVTAIDCLWAKARLSERMDCCVPKVSEDGPIRILGGCHPLLESTPERPVVALTLELGVDYTTLVISGPNAGGKSVALKCVGLLCVMAGCGLHVPALPGTELPLFADIQVDIGDQQSISDDLSTFTAHITRLKEILKVAGSNTLVLIDEIGAGTDPQEGASISIASLEQLTWLKTPTIVTTHHGTLKAFAHSTDGCANGSMEFDINTFQPTYRFRPNVPGSSYALDIARHAGLSDDLIDRAREVLGSDRTHLEDLITSLSEKVMHYESLLMDEKQIVETQKAREDAYGEKLERLKTREQELKKRAREEADDLLREARHRVEAVVKEIREKDADKESILKAHQELDRLNVDIGVEVEEPEEETIQADELERKKYRGEKRERLRPLDKEPEVGDRVRIDGSSETGEVSAISSRGDRICVVVGAVQLWLARDRVTVVKEAKTSGEGSCGRAVLPKTVQVPLELDLRGMNAQEAVSRVERYLHDGAAEGREQLAIIHGKGAGVLSRSVRSHLKNHPAVKSFRFGEYGEGDYGVTVVTLKK